MNNTTKMLTGRTFLQSTFYREQYLAMSGELFLVKRQQSSRELIQLEIDI